MTPVEVEHLISTIHDYTKRNIDNWRVPDYRWLAHIVKANVYLGLRLGEVTHARWEHVDLDRRTLAVLNTEEFTTKRGKERVLPVPELAHEVLAAFWESRGDLPRVFTSHHRSRRSRTVNWSCPNGPGNFLTSLLYDCR